MLNDCRVLIWWGHVRNSEVSPETAKRIVEVSLEERRAGGEWFRSGAFWSIGDGAVFYFRPGHETYPIHKQPIPLRIITNAVRFLAGQ